MSCSVTRLLKASKSSEKSTSSRNSLLSRTPSTTSQSIMQAYRSSSNLSLNSDDIPMSTSYDVAPSFSNNNNPTLPGSTNKKLQSAQAELQACEAHLALKERELDLKRSAAVKEGLNLRCRALVECGHRWINVGKEMGGALDFDSNPQGIAFFLHAICSDSSTN